MSLVIDFLLLAASGAACFYCWVLSGRLKGLTDTKNGIHAGIAALSRSAEEMQTAMMTTKETASKSAGEIEALIKQADERVPELRNLLTQLTDISVLAADETELATRQLVETLTPHIKEARQVAHLLLGSLEDASAANIRLDEISDVYDKPQRMSDIADDKDKPGLEVVSSGETAASGEAA